MGVVFGTDGVRGVANRELSPELAFELGLVVGSMLPRSCGRKRPSVVIGRVLVRPSGTEALVRVMAEEPDERELPGYVEGIVEVVKEELEYSVV